MKKNTIFNIGLDVFPRFVHDKVNFLQRDMAEFIKYGYSPKKADALDELISNFEDAPTDEEYAGDVMIATEKKNALAEEMLLKIRSLMLRVQNKFGQRSAYYKKFGASALSKLTDEKLLKTARRVARVATIYQAELKEQGLTAAHIKELKTMAAEFDDLMEAQSDAIADREIGTALRIKTANEIYAEISRVCETGKGIWKDVNEAKYNDYIIYDTPAAKPEEEISVAEEEVWASGWSPKAE